MRSTVPSAVRLQQLAEFVAVESGVAKDPAESAALQLAVQWHDEKDRAIGMLESHMAAALPYGFPALLLERADQLGAGDDRQALAHTEIGSLRRTTPLSIGRPSSRRPSIYNSSASRALSVASSRSSPCVCRPGSSGA